jgi:hypothetical protein
MLTVMLELSQAPALPEMISTEPQSLDQVVSLIAPIITFVKNGQYLMAGAAVTLVLVFLFKTFILPRIALTTQILPLLSAVLGLFAGLSISILAGATPLQAMIAMGSGPAASLLWDSILKFFLTKKPAEASISVEQKPAA